MFRIFDRDGDGKVSLKEFIETITLLGGIDTRPNPNPHPNRGVADI